MDDLQSAHFFDNTVACLFHINTLPHHKHKKLNLDLSYMREIASLCYKVIAGGEQLTENVFQKLVFTYCLKYNIPLKPPGNDNAATEAIDRIIDFTMNDDTFATKLRENIRANKNQAQKKTFWPTSMWRSRFLKRFNLKKSQGKGTLYCKEGLLCQLVPSLEMTYAIRKLFNIPAQEGRVLNLDESMTLRYDQHKKKWTY